MFFPNDAVDTDPAISLEAVALLKACKLGHTNFWSPAKNPPILHLFYVSATLHALFIMQHQNAKKLFVTQIKQPKRCTLSCKIFYCLVV
jgi:hypothetical protein